MGILDYKQTRLRLRLLLNVSSPISLPKSFLFRFCTLHNAPNTDTPLCSCSLMFLHPYVPTYTPLCSYTPMFLQPMFLHPYVPTTYVPTLLCSYTPMFLHPMFLQHCVPTPLCSYAPIFLPPYILTLFTRSALGEWN